MSKSDFSIGSKLRHLLPIFLLLAITTCLFSHVTPTFAQQPLSAIISSVDSLYRYGEMDLAEHMAIDALNRKDLTPDERFRLEMLLAYAYVAKNDREGARQAFIRALTIRPEYKLDPDQTSPKIFEFFEEARIAFRAQLTTSKEDLESLRKYKLRWQGTPSGMLFPAWGLARQKKNTDAWVLGTLETVAIGAAAYATLSTITARDDYKNAGVNDDIARKWNTYRDWNRMQGYLWGSVGVIHLLGISDVLFGKLPAGTSISISNNQGIPSATFTVHFLQIMQ